MSPESGRAIGVFDSGVGGLTVLKALMERLPEEKTLYLGDTARVPYGTKSGEVVTRYSLKNAEFLLERGIKLLVVACNTASAVALPALARALPVPVLGVIAPGARAALAVTRNQRVGVIGTPGTIRSGAYQRELVASGAQVTAHACPHFVPLAEEGWVTGEVPQAVAREYLRPFADAQVDTLVLGCTHYPLLKDVIGAVLGPAIKLVDSAQATADAVEALLAESGMLAPSGQEASHGYFVTDVPERFAEVGARFLGRAMSGVEQIDLSF